MAQYEFNTFWPVRNIQFYLHYDLSQKGEAHSKSFFYQLEKTTLFDGSVNKHAQPIPDMQDWLFSPS